MSESNNSPVNKSTSPRAIPFGDITLSQQELHDNSVILINDQPTEVASSSSTGNMPLSTLRGYESPKVDGKIDKLHFCID